MFKNIKKKLKTKKLVPRPKKVQKPRKIDQPPKDKDVLLMRDKTKPLTKRKEAFNRLRNKMLNPKLEKDFNPETFDPLEEMPDAELGARSRKDPPRVLPTKGLKPKEILEGQMVGMYESKQDLYLLIAWLSKRVTELEDDQKGDKKGGLLDKK